MILYRPIGKKEYDLIKEANFEKFPPRLSWQPIFYPVLNQKYAEKIAGEWNTKDENSDFIGIITRFNVKDEYVNRFEKHIVGSSICEELWIPSEELDEFNKNIIGKIEIIKIFYGENYKYEIILENEQQLELNLTKNIEKIIDENNELNNKDILWKSRGKVVEYKNNGGDQKMAYKTLHELYILYDKTNEEEKRDFVADILDIIVGWIGNKDWLIWEEYLKHI
jgi:hypothetical protein